jgi:hypothetical protein
MLATGIGEDLRIDKARIERRVDAGDVFPNEGLEPTFGLCAIKRMARIAG